MYYGVDVLDVGGFQILSLASICISLEYYFLTQYYMTYNRIISGKTYKTFMKKYKIPLLKKQNDKYVYKSMSEMSKEIYEYETNNNIMTGLYFYS